MYSAALIKEEFLNVKKNLKAVPQAGNVIRLLDRCNRRLLDVKRVGDWDTHFGGKRRTGLRCRFRSVLGESYRMLADVKLLSLELMSLLEMEIFFK